MLKLNYASVYFRDHLIRHTRLGVRLDSNRVFRIFESFGFTLLGFRNISYQHKHGIEYLMNIVYISNIYIDYYFQIFWLPSSKISEKEF